MFKENIGGILKKYFSIILRVLISFGLLGGLVYFLRKDFNNIFEIIKTCELNYILLGLFLFLITSNMLAYRLKVVFNGEDLFVTYPESVQLTFLGYFFNNFMPTAVGGDIVKAHYSVKTKSERMRSYASVMMDRLIGLYSFITVAALALLIDGGRFSVNGIRPLVFTFLIFSLVLFIAATNRKVAKFMESIFSRVKLGGLGDKLDSLYKIVHDYRNRIDVLLKALGVSLLGQSIYFVTIYLFFLAIGSDVSIGNVFLVMPVVTFISMIPSIGGLGVREGAIVAFFSPLAGKNAAFAVSMLLLLSLFLASFIGGMTYLYWMTIKKRVIKE